MLMKKHSKKIVQSIVASYDSIDQDILLGIIQSQDFTYEMNPENLSELFDNIDSDFELDLERLHGILQNVQDNQNIDPESMFSILQTLLLSYEQIDPQTLSTIIQQFDLNNQIDNETIEYLLCHSLLKCIQDVPRGTSK